MDEAASVQFAGVSMVQFERLTIVDDLLTVAGDETLAKSEFTKEAVVAPQPHPVMTTPRMQFTS